MTVIWPVDIVLPRKENIMEERALMSFEVGKKALIS